MAVDSAVGKQGLFEKKKLSERVSEKLGKTKAAASTGIRKVKDGASSSAYWMKVKYHDLKTNRNLK